MRTGKLWHWRIVIRRGEIAGVSAQPIDSSTDPAFAEVTDIYLNHGEMVAELEVVADTRTAAERLALDAYARDVPEDMRDR